MKKMRMFLPTISYKKYFGVNLGKFHYIWVFLKAVLKFSLLGLFMFFLDVWSIMIKKKGRVNKSFFIEAMQ